MAAGGRGSPHSRLIGMAGRKGDGGASSGRSWSRAEAGPRVPARLGPTRTAGRGGFDAHGHRRRLVGVACDRHPNVVVAPRTSELGPHVRVRCRLRARVGAATWPPRPGSAAVLSASRGRERDRGMRGRSSLAFDIGLQDRARHTVSPRPVRPAGDATPASWSIGEPTAKRPWSCPSTSRRHLGAANQHRPALGGWNR
jgi:hypothetical protein